MGFWYENLKSIHGELKNLSENASQLEKDNLLMKLRDSLTDRDDSGNGTKVVYPQGISIYPDNVPYFWWAAVSCILMCVFWTLFLVAIDYKAIAEKYENKYGNK